MQDRGNFLCVWGHWSGQFPEDTRSRRSGSFATSADMEISGNPTEEWGLRSAYLAGKRQLSARLRPLERAVSRTYKVSQIWEFRNLSGHGDFGKPDGGVGFEERISCRKKATFCAFGATGPGSFPKIQGLADLGVSPPQRTWRFRETRRRSGV